MRGKEAEMNTITTEALISNDHKISLNLDVPESYPIGKAIVTITIATQAIPDFTAPEREEWQMREMQKAIEEADAEDFATDEEVLAIKNKWGIHAN
jgi:predicted transcriptional regulator